MIDFLKELEDSFRGNGVDISGMPGEVTIEDGKLFISKHMALDFSEHDKMVAKEKDKRIAELEKENSALKEKLSLIRTRATAEAREFWDKDMFGSFIITIPRKSNDNAIIEKLEEDLNRLTMDLKNRMGQIYELQEENKMLKEENKNLEAFTKNLLEDSDYVLEDRHQSDCIRINQLLTTIDVLTERYQKLREVHGL